MLRYLNRASDAAYAMARFADVDDPELFAGPGGVEVTAPMARARRREGFAHDVEVDGHSLVVDEPEERAAPTLGPRPTRLLTGGARRPAPRSRSRCTRTARAGSSGDVEVDVDIDYDGRGARLVLGRR